MKWFAKEVTNWVFNLAYSYLSNEQDAEEITQDTLIAALDGLSGFNQQSELKTWVYRIAINKCKDFLKYKNRKKRFGTMISLSIQTHEKKAKEVTDGYHPGLILENKEEALMLMRAIDRLPEQQRLALLMTKFEQMSMSETADIMNTSSKAVESLISRAKQNLRSYLQKM